jgi:hypothetical protein
MHQFERRGRENPGNNFLVSRRARTNRKNSSTILQEQSSIENANEKTAKIRIASI